MSKYDGMSEAQKDAAIVIAAAVPYIAAMEGDELLGKLALLALDIHGGSDRVKEACERLGTTFGVGSPLSVLL